MWVTSQEPLEDWQTAGFVYTEHILDLMYTRNETARLISVFSHRGKAETREEQTTAR